VSLIASISLGRDIAHTVNHSELLMCGNIYSAGFESSWQVDESPDVTPLLVIFEAWFQDCEMTP
jgi:hypothetical protein